VKYLDEASRSRFGAWFDGLNAQAAAMVAVALTRMERGALSNLKAVGAGVLEYRIDFDPGYRIYLGRDGPELIILLAGGAKQRQQRDIEAAKSLWADYRARKKGKG
jgi:putative addiction module killer protein